VRNNRCLYVLADERPNDGVGPFRASIPIEWYRLGSALASTAAKSMRCSARTAPGSRIIKRSDGVQFGVDTCIAAARFAAERQSVSGWPAAIAESC